MAKIKVGTVGVFLVDNMECGDTYWEILRYDENAHVLWPYQLIQRDRPATKLEKVLYVQD